MIHARALLLLALLALCVALPASAAPPAFDHLLDAADQVSAATALVAAPDGDLVVIGYAAGKGGRAKDDRPRLVRLAPDGTIRWEREHPEINFSYPKAAAMRPDGQIELAIRRISRTQRPLWARVDAQGALLAHAEMGDRGCLPSGIAAVEAGAVIIGYCTGAGGRIEPWMEGLSREGARTWRHTFDATPRALEGIATAPDGKAVVIAGWEFGGPGQHNDGLLMQVDAATGAIAWTRRHGGPAVQTLRVITWHGGHLVAGGAAGEKEALKPWLIGLSTDGKAIKWRWQPTDPAPGAVTALASGPHGLVAGGYLTNNPYGTYGRAWLASVGAGGTQRWWHEYGKGQQEAVAAIAQTAQGIVAAGRHGSRKSYLNGLWILGVGPDGAPAGPRSARGASR